jgi:dTDP-glucose pyrophosphorylase
MMDSDKEKLLIHNTATIREAMKQLDETGKRLLIVINEDGKLFGTLTDGDIRRWILAGGDLKNGVDSVCNINPFYAKIPFEKVSLKEEMARREIDGVPIVKDNNIIHDVFFPYEITDIVSINKVKPIDLPVIIMAGGKGTRLDPFTKILPKPLIPINDKTIIEYIIDSFLEYGVNSFYMTINYKGNIIRSYFDELNPDYSLHYVEEDRPLGTAGSLRLLDGVIKDTCIVTNCDIIISTNYYELVKYHNDNNYDLTLVASVKHYNIPYGICNIVNGGELSEITEKPEYKFLVNTGLYVINSNSFKYIPEAEMFHVTHLIDKIKENGGRVGVFPIGEDAWLDTGEWAEYKKTMEKFQI